MFPSLRLDDPDGDGGCRTDAITPVGSVGEALRRIEQIETDIVRAKTRRESFHHTRLRKVRSREVERLHRLHKVEMKRLVAEVDAVPALAARLSVVESVERRPRSSRAYGQGEADTKRCSCRTSPSATRAAIGPTVLRSPGRSRPRS